MLYSLKLSLFYSLNLIQYCKFFIFIYFYAPITPGGLIYGGLYS
ncbi:hypothetical protein HMPREF1119_0082 [Haemophilus parainfluenzae HK2019]|uniref:Uncharacterized protein n=1 Tax=Haemophilus parainfluenzae HK2019 TaxID=1095746 RepID=A0ABP2NZN1_HAEPA|nr:hypothetical protein HMPREF1119_0082 [Haemophilus parainfluenzae HK2019]DAK16736.1 MAG TPA: hypothetical protein [Caudoviricetes sp.]DAN55680.1 MAG TPA: hypothetical protein [Caudoviricetes sp.]DAU85006.1 MAG TPA: hypothetical protein [Caudoviricetes sp.]